jgi:AraC-like DNA-binding protein
MKENFNRIIDALEVKYLLASRREVVKPVELLNTIEQKDILFHTISGFFTAGVNYEPVPEDCFYLIPRGNSIHFKHGKGPYAVLGSEGFTSPEERQKYLKTLKNGEQHDASKDVFSIIGFEVLIHGAIPFFSILELPCLCMGENQELKLLLNKIIEEEQSDRVGKTAMTKKYCEQMVVCICRHIYDQPALQGSLQKLNYLLDKRLISIIQYIQFNLEKDLSNNIIASLAYVSKDYVGQFFKSLTNHNLQDYIENRRLEHAHYLLRITNDNIQEIAHKVGFKDPAYFSRRFKIRFNQNAKEVRKSDYVVM